MDLNHSIAFNSTAANCSLQEFIQMPTHMLSQIPQPIYEVVQDSAQREILDPLAEHLKIFWAERYREVQDITDFKKHKYPLARIKKVMKSNQRVQMISAEALLLFANACEFLTLELASRSWLETVGGNRRTLQKADIANALCKSPSFNFLCDVVPNQQYEEDDRAPRRVQRQYKGPIPNGNRSDSNGLIEPNEYNRPNISDVPNGIYVPNTFIAPSGTNDYNGPIRYNVQNGPFVFKVPNNFTVPSGANGFDGPSDLNMPNELSFSTMDPNLFQQSHNVSLTNNVLQFPMMPTHQCQMNYNPVEVEGFYGKDMGAETSNEDVLFSYDELC